jgi:hypothetical protein
MKKEAERLGTQVKDEIANITRRLFGRNTSSARHTAAFAILDLPFAAVRRFVGVGEPPPYLVDDLISKAYSAVIEGAKAP